MAYPYGTGSGVTGMKKTGRSNTDIHTFIKAGLVILLVVYLTLLYTADNAKNIPIEQITASMESNETITSLNKEERTDLKHYYQVDERDIDGSSIRLSEKNDDAFCCTEYNEYLIVTE